MKKLLLIVCVLAGFSYAKAQAPQGFSYQAAVRNAAGLPLANTPVKVRFSILDSVANGPVVYKETHTTTTNAGGLFNVNVGLGTAITGTLAGVNWGTNAKFLQVEIDTTATGNNYTNIGVQQLMSVPYALYAGNTNSSSASNYNLNPSADSVLSLIGGKILETGTYTVPANEHWKIVSIYGSPNFGGSILPWSFQLGNNLSANTCECRYIDPGANIFRIKNDLYKALVTPGVQSITIQAISPSACPLTYLFPTSNDFDLKRIVTPIWLEPNEQFEIYTDVRVSIEKYK